jgi:hypothetical protein
MNFLALNDNVKFIISNHLASDLKIRALLSKKHDLQKILFGDIMHNDDLCKLPNLQYDAKENDDTYVYVCIYVYIYIYINTHTHKHTHSHTTHTHTHTHNTHTHTQGPKQGFLPLEMAPFRIEIVRSLREGASERAREEGGGGSDAYIHTCIHAYIEEHIH